MQISTYQHAHQTQVIELILQIQCVEFGLPITLNDQPDLLEIPAVYQQGNGNFWVALDGDRVIGTIAAIDMGTHQLALRKMFVLAPYRGSAIGIGKRLVETLFDWAATRNVSEIYLGTIDIFKAAHRFYEKHGFQRIGEADLPATFPRMLSDDVFYRRIIAKS